MEGMLPASTQEGKKNPPKKAENPIEKMWKTTKPWLRRAADGRGTSGKHRLQTRTRALQRPIGRFCGDRSAATTATSGGDAGRLRSAHLYGHTSRTASHVPNSDCTMPESTGLICPSQSMS